MANGEITLNPPATPGGKVLSTEEVTVGGHTVQVQRVELYGDNSQANNLTVTANQGAGGVGAWKVDGSAVTQPVSASSLPLPTGAATAAKQPALGASGTPSADVLTIQGVSGMTAVKVDGSAVTQPVSAASLPLPSGAATSAKQPALGTAGTPSSDVITVQGATGMTAVKVDGSASTQPISGTVTANIGTSGSLALDATLTGGSQKAIARGGAKGSTTAADITSNNIDANTQALHVDGSKVTQPISAASLPLPTGAATSAKQPALGAAGSPSADVLTVQGAASMTALKVDGSGVTQPVSAASLPLPSGASTSAKQPALGTAGTPSADVITVQGAASMTALKVDGSATTQPVSGTVTANIGTSGSLALDSTLTGGTQKAIVRGGAKGSTSAADVTSSAIDSNTQALHVDGSKVTQPVSATSLPLPSGAATSAKQPALGTAGTPSTDVITVQGVTSMTALKVDGSGVTQPISAASLPLPSGASTAAKQPALGTAGSASADVITIQGIASMTAVKVDGSAVTQPVSAASLPLPSGAATSAKQPALGTAGSASSDVLTVQGISSMTALKTDGSGVTQPVSGTVTAQQATASSLNATAAQGAAASASAGWPVTGGVAATASATWTTSTTTGSTISATVTGYSTVALFFNPIGGAPAGGTLALEISADNMNWAPVAASNMQTGQVYGSTARSVGNGTSNNDVLVCSVIGANYFRVRLTTAITSNSSLIQVVPTTLAIPAQLTVAQGTKGASTSGWPITIYDSVGNQLGNSSHPVVIDCNNSAVTGEVIVDQGSSGAESDPWPVKLIDVTSNKTKVLKTGTLASTTNTADQVVLTYTVTTGKTFYVCYLAMQARLTTYANTATLFGSVSLELPSGTKVITHEIAHSGDMRPIVIPFAEPLFATSAQVIRVVCTPAAAANYTWSASFGGYER